ncbi:MAG TPA: hypothetical protein VF715_16515 [Thermoleophilaceae bacterium]|jgi:hypothetical protein
MFDFDGLIFIAFLIIAFAGIVIGYFTAAGSGITPRPYANQYGGARGAWGPGNASGKDDYVSQKNWSRGTR